VGARSGTEADVLRELGLERRPVSCGSKVWNGGRCSAGAGSGTEAGVLREQDHLEQRQISCGSKIIRETILLVMRVLILINGPLICNILLY
jgi:hypothetical protein